MSCLGRVCNYYHRGLPRIFSNASEGGVGEPSIANVWRAETGSECEIVIFDIGVIQNGSDGNGDAIVNKLLTLPYEYFRKYEKPIRRFLKTAKLADDIDIHKKFGTTKWTCDL